MIQHRINHHLSKNHRLSKVLLLSVCSLWCGFVHLFAQISIKAVGDVLPGSYTPQRMLPSDSGRTTVQNVSGLLRGADIVFGNFEASFAREGDPAMKPQKCAEASRRKGVCFEFGVPPYLAPMLKQMGFTVMSVDNNHADDYGAAAAELTKTLLLEQGIKPAPKRGFAELSIKGKRVAVVAFGFSNTSYNVAEPQAARDIVAALTKQFPMVIVSFHGGAEGKKALHVPNRTEMFYGENRGNLVAFAHACIDAGAAMVIGHGPHVVRAVELYKERLIAYSLGNFATFGNINVKGVNGVTLVLEASIDEASGKFLSGRIHPVVQREPGIPYPDPTNEAVRLIKQLTEEDFPQTPLSISDTGEIRVRR